MLTPVCCICPKRCVEVGYLPQKYTRGYDVKKDEYTCQAGQKLRAKYVGKRKSKSGFESEITYYECDDCSACPHI